MIRTDVMSLQDMINRGIERAHTTVKEVLVSYTEKVTTEDPFLVFERARALKQNRTFWKSATEDFYVITVGENMHIRAHDKTRYEYTYQTRSEEHTSELQSRGHLVCRLLLEKKK